MQSLFFNIINFLLPPDHYEGNKITDLSWFQKHTAYAPHIVLGTLFLLLVWGLFASNPLNLIIKPQYFLVFYIVFWLSLIGLAVHMTRKRKRDPSIFQLLASFIVLSGLVCLMLFSVATYYLVEQKAELEHKKHQIAQEVQKKLKQNKSHWEEHSKILHQRSQEIQERVDKAFSELDSRMESRFDRFRETWKSNSEIFWKGVEENRAEFKKIRENHFKSAEKMQERVNQRTREWCRTHPLSQMCKDLPPEDPNNSDIYTPQTTNP